jgi:hypothetical protein
VILTDREIRIAIHEKQIIIDPVPEVAAFSSTSVDLALASKVLVFKGSTTGGGAIDPGSRDYDYRELANQIMDEADLDQQPFNLNRGNLLLAWTHERVDLRILSRLAARVEGKSSLAPDSASIRDEDLSADLRDDSWGSRERLCGAICRSDEWASVRRSAWRIRKRSLHYSDQRLLFSLTDLNQSSSRRSRAGCGGGSCRPCQLQRPYRRFRLPDKPNPAP